MHQKSFPAERYLVATGEASISGRKVEIVDLSDPTKNCYKLDDISYRYASAGGLLEGHPVICGGVGALRDCIVFGSSQNVAFEMKQSRRHFSAVSLNSSMLWLLGSDTGHTAVQSTEFISLRQGKGPLTSTDGPYMPFRLGYSCVVKFNDTTIYILGGVQSGSTTNRVWIASISDKITFNQGPSMVYKRSFHACGTISVGNKNLIVVAGGNGRLSSRSMEILDPSVNLWVEEGTFYLQGGC